MKVKVSGVRIINITGDFIRLDSLLKYAAIVSTGGEAKLLINGGEVFVCGAPCYERGRKIRAGDVVRCGGGTLLVKHAG